MSVRTPEATIRLAARLYAAGAFQKDIAEAIKRSASAIKVWRRTSPIWQDEMEKYPWVPADRQRVRKTGYAKVGHRHGTPWMATAPRDAWIVEMHCKERHSTREIGRALRMQSATVLQRLVASGSEHRKYQIGRGFVPELPDALKRFRGDVVYPEKNKYERMHERRARIQNDFENGCMKSAAAYTEEYHVDKVTIYKDLKALGLHPVALTRKPRGNT